MKPKQNLSCVSYKLLHVQIYISRPYILTHVQTHTYQHSLIWFFSSVLLFFHLIFFSTVKYAYLSKSSFQTYNIQGEILHFLSFHCHFFKILPSLQKYLHVLVSTFVITLLYLHNCLFL